MLAIANTPDQEWEDLITILGKEYECKNWDFTKNCDATTQLNSSCIWHELQENIGIKLFQECDIKMENLNHSPDDQILKFIKSELPDFNDIQEPCSSNSLNNVHEKPKFCVICGVETKCYHYDVASCHGCKTFFRRTIILKKTYACKRDGDCNIAEGTRCRACRFDQCILAGMNLQAINFPDEVNVQQVAADLAKRKRSLLDNTQPVVCKSSPTFDQSLYCNEIDSLVYLEYKTRRLRESTYNPTNLYSSISEILKFPSALATVDKYQKPPDWPLDINKVVTQIEKSRLHDLPHPPELDIRKRHWLSTDIVLAIEMAKVLPIYQKLDETDKVILLAHVSLVNAALTSSFYSYENKAETIFYPDGLMPIMSRLTRQKQLCKLEIEVFYRCIEPIRRVDLSLTEYVLLKTIIYCYSAVPSLSDNAKKLLSKQYEIYGLTLLRYMQAHHGEAKGAQKYMETIALVETFSYIAKCKRQLYIFMSLEDQKRTCGKRMYHPRLNKLLDFIMLK